MWLEISSIVNSDKRVDSHLAALQHVQAQLTLLVFVPSAGSDAMGFTCLFDDTPIVAVVPADP